MYICVYIYIYTCTVIYLYIYISIHLSIYLSTCSYFGYTMNAVNWSQADRSVREVLERRKLLLTESMVEICRACAKLLSPTAQKRRTPKLRRYVYTYDT